MSRWLVTGGAGFIGSNIVDELVRLGEEAVVLDNFVSGKKENLSDSASRIKLIEGDLRRDKDLEESLEGVDYVLHQAALRSVPKSIDNPLEYDEVNVGGTLRLLLEAKDAGVKRVVFASSSSVYGEAVGFPQKELDYPRLISPYAATKLSGEYYCRVFSKAYDLETVSLRYFNVFGPRQGLDDEYAVVVPKFIISCLKNEPLPIHGDGKQSRDFTYVDNVVQANIQAATAPGVSGEVFNIACGREQSILQLAREVKKITASDSEEKHQPPRAGDVRRTLSDIGKAKKMMGYQPTIGFREGLEKTVKYFKTLNSKH